MNEQQCLDHRWALFEAGVCLADGLVGIMYNAVATWTEHATPSQETAWRNMSLDIDRHVHLAQQMHEPGRLCFPSRTVRVCVAFLLELTELARPVEMPCLCCNTHPQSQHQVDSLRAGQAGRDAMFLL